MCILQVKLYIKSVFIVNPVSYTHLRAHETLRHLVCRLLLEKKQYDYFIFGHSHIPLDVELTPESKYINLGDWITNFTYAEFNGENLSLKRFD